MTKDYSFFHPRHALVIWKSPYHNDSVSVMRVNVILYGQYVLIQANDNWRDYSFDWPVGTWVSARKYAIP
jgi:hypothetical protein